MIGYSHIRLDLDYLGFGLGFDTGIDPDIDLDLDFGIDLDPHIHLDYIPVLDLDLERNILDCGFDFGSGTNPHSSIHLLHAYPHYHH
jgi:hypothetical protein